MDDSLDRIIRYFQSPVPADLRRITGLETRRQWDVTAGILNRGAPAGKVDRGHVIRFRRGKELTADLYPPNGSAPFPAILFIHGGAWVGGSPRTHNKLALRLAERGYYVISVEYALAPEDRFPRGLEDCVFAAKWLEAEAENLGIDGSRLAVMGDSAGGNLAAATIHKLLAQDGTTAFRAAVLAYGVYDFLAMLELPTTSPFVNGHTFAWQAEDYLGEAFDEALLTSSEVSPRFSPYLEGFPPTFMSVGTNDPVLQQTLAFAEALRAAETQVEVSIYEGAMHAFLQIEELQAAGEGLEDIVHFLQISLPD